MAKAFEDNEHTNQWIKKQVHSSTKRSGWNVQICADQEDKRKRQKSFKEALVLQDAKLRQQIHEVIKQMKEQGKSKLEVIFALSKMPEFKRYSPYFKTWVENDYRENHNKSPWTTIPITQKTKEDEER